jgi:hypothetical protein
MAKVKKVNIAVTYARMDEPKANDKTLLELR